ncbi:MAG: nucleotide exchange factor GrpE, partial [Leptolyngbyaceae bacterium]|nr:nucleotide exchange factor GrpE [Leptolyngbyaceae bacterium]
TRSPRELANQKIQLRKQQETLLRDLLTVVDALDHAADHWHQATVSQSSATDSQADVQSKPQSATSSSSPAPSSVIDRLQHWLQQLGIVSSALSGRNSDRPPHSMSESSTSESSTLQSRTNAKADDDDEPTLAEVITSARDGVDMIRESMMTVLNKHQVVPVATQGQPFDPTYMNALGQQPDDRVPPNTVIQEVVKGYRWQDRILREAQVIVAVPSTPASNSPS